MELDQKLSFHIHDELYSFRSLSALDVTKSYVQALKRQKAFLSNNPEDITIQWQKNYIEKIRSSPFDTICGLYQDSRLIGTSGIQNLTPLKITTLGIFVLEEKCRGKGYGKSLIWSSCFLSNICLGINRYEAGIDKVNIPSLRSFLSCGFKIIFKDAKYYRVQLNIDELKKPTFITDIFCG